VAFDLNEGEDDDKKSDTEYNELDLQDFLQSNQNVENLENFERSE